MSNEEILHIAMQQSAIESGCRAEDFSCGINKVVLSSISSNARKYLDLPFYCDLTSYGNNIVASVSKEIYGFVMQYINKYPVEDCFDVPNIHILNEELKKYRMRVHFMAEYFLPDVDILSPLSCGYNTRLLKPEDFEDYYLPQWSNALCEKRKDLDILAVGAFDNDRLIGLAGCAADCDTMWQIGVDVLPEYRRQGIASALTSRLAVEILNRDIVPFYCCSWANIKSARNAVKSGFRPAWVQMTAKSIDFS